MNCKLKIPKMIRCKKFKSPEPENLREKILAVWYMYYLTDKQFVVLFLKMGFKK